MLNEKVFLSFFFNSMWKHIGKNPEYVMVGDTEDSHRGKQVREPMVGTNTSFKQRELDPNQCDQKKSPNVY